MWALCGYALGCGGDHDHSVEDPAAGTNPTGDARPGEILALPAEVVAAACADQSLDEVEARPATTATGALLLVPTDGTPVLVQPEAGEPTRVAFVVAVDHGNWRILVGHDASFGSLRFSRSLQRVAPLVVRDASCATRWRQSVYAHLHATGTAVIELETDTEQAFWIAVLLESVGH